VHRIAVANDGQQRRAIVQAGDALGEVACAGDRLQVEMTLGQQEVARVRVGQGAKLLYDAFPYQRFGVKFGSVRWLGRRLSDGLQCRAERRRCEGFRALIDANDSTIMVSGEARPLLFGMRGAARVVTGRRSLISFAFEPIRALRGTSHRRRRRRRRNDPDGIHWTDARPMTTRGVDVFELARVAGLRVSVAFVVYREGRRVTRRLV